MAVKQVTAFQTENGKLFEFESDAISNSISDRLQAALVAMHVQDERWKEETKDRAKSFVLTLWNRGNRDAIVDLLKEMDQFQAS